MTTLTVGRVTEYPRVNLLPPEVAKAAQFRRLRALLTALVVGALAIVGVLYVMAVGQVGQAEDALASAQAENAQLQAEVATYSDIPAIQADLAAYEGNLTLAMAPEVRWSFYLNDLSLTIPASVRLSAMTVTEPVDYQAATDPAAAAVASPLGTPGIATIVFEGKASSYDAVASWLQSLARQKGYVDPTVTSISKDTDGGTQGTVYSFSSSVTVDAEALSGRYLPSDGE